MENRLDPFFRGKLSSHETPFAEEHWMQMQVLMKEQKKKKKRIFFWLIFSALLFVGIGSWLVWTNSGQQVPNQNEMPVKSMDSNQRRSDVATSSALKNNQTTTDQAVAHASEANGAENIHVTPESGGSKVSIIATSRQKMIMPKKFNNESNASILIDEKTASVLTTQNGVGKVTNSTTDSMHANSTALPVQASSDLHAAESECMALESKLMDLLTSPIPPLAFQAPGLRSIHAKKPWEFYLGAGAVVSAKEMSKPGMRLEIGALKRFRHLGLWSVGAGMEWWNNSPASVASTVNEVKYGFGRTEYTYELKPADLRVIYAQVLWQVRFNHWHLHIGPQIRYLPLQKTHLNTYSSSSLSPNNALLRSEQGYQTTSELQLRRWLPGLQTGIHYRWKQWELTGSALWMSGSWLLQTSESMPKGNTFTFQSQLRYYFKWNK